MGKHYMFLEGEASLLRLQYFTINFNVILIDTPVRIIFEHLVNSF